jgi:methylated-DNA-protein-cysteine methyltransferase-like protein
MHCFLESTDKVNVMSNETSPIHKQTTTLMAQIFALVQSCPIGRVTTYSWLAKAVGYPRGARMVGWIMNETRAGIPAQRVINSKGELSGSWAFGSPERMRLLLESEGITFSDNGKVDLKQYGWDPLRDLSETERQHILENIDETTEHPSTRLIGLMQYDAASPLKGIQQS